MKLARRAGRRADFSPPRHPGRPGPAPALACLLALALGACALQPGPERDAIMKDALPQTVVPPRYAAPGGADGAVAGAWLATFSDPELDALVREALQYNADLRVAQARIEQAAAYLKASGATLYPQVSLLARGGGKMSDASGLSGVGLFANWELDLWGRVRAGQAFAQRQYDAVQLDAEYARQSIAAMVAKGWFLATEARMQMAQAQAMRQASEALAGLAQDRLRVGRGDEFDVSIARANVATLRDTERTLEAAYQQALRGIEVLAEREAILASAVRENARAYELAGVRYRVGSGDLRGVQQQQLALYSAQVALLRVQAERLVQRVNLHLALGGSFEATAVR